MKIAVLSDIHGNIFALNAVMREIYQMQIDRVYFLGDMVGYYYHPKEVFQKLQEIKSTSILGNHEQLLFDCLDGKIESNELSARYGSGHKIALEQFSNYEIENLRNLPEQHFETLMGISIACFHGSPFDKDFYLYPDVNKTILSKCVTLADFTFVGHSHYPFVAQLPKGTLVNVGSVGQSRKKGGLASWCVLNLDNCIVEMQSTNYDIKPLLDLVEKHDPTISYLSSILKRGLND
jgi:putative phosphoesterase